MKKKVWQADFFDDWDDLIPSRSMTISAVNEEKAVSRAVARMGAAARVEFTRTTPERKSGLP
jgi:hypothetical protein